MEVKKEIVEHIALLARIKLSEEEKKIYSCQLTQILDYVEQLNKVDTKKIEPTYQITQIVNAMRKDVAKPSKKEKILISTAPQREKDFVKVKAVFE